MRPVKARGGDGLTGREATWSIGEDKFARGGLRTS